MFDLEDDLAGLDGIDPPAAGEQNDPFAIGLLDGRLVVAGRLNILGVVVGAESEETFVEGDPTLVPESGAGPGVGALHTSVADADPGVVVEDLVRGEELNLTDLAAEAGEKMEAPVGIVRRVREGSADDEGPAFDGRGDEEDALAAAHEGFGPGWGESGVDAEQVTEEVGIAGADGEPAWRRDARGGGPPESEQAGTFKSAKCRAASPGLMTVKGDERCPEEDNDPESSKEHEEKRGHFQTY